MAESMFKDWQNITWEQVKRVDSGKRGVREPCLVCGVEWRACAHGLVAAQNLIEAVNRLNPSQRVFLHRRDQRNKRKAQQVESKESLHAQAKELVDKANEMLEAAKRLEAEAATRYEYPKEPSFPVGSIDVRYRDNGQSYRYIIFKPSMGGPIFTTGRLKNAYFENWNAFVDWLRSDDVTWNSKLESMQYGVTQVVLP